MDEATYASVVNEMKLPSGLMFSLPVVMDTRDESIAVGAKYPIAESPLFAPFFVVFRSVPDTKEKPPSIVEKVGPIQSSLALSLSLVNKSLQY